MRFEMAVFESQRSCHEIWADGGERCLEPVFGVAREREVDDMTVAILHRW